jgi:hypothetical protein
MFAFHAAFALGMISLTMGTALYAWASSRHEPGRGFARLIGVLVILFSLTSTLCTVYYGIKYWKEGYFQGPMAMRCMKMQDQSMMDNKTEMPKVMEQSNNHKQHTH